MSRSPVVVRGLAAAFFALAAVACGEQAASRATSSDVSARTITPQVFVRSAGDTAFVTLALDVRGDTGRIGSYTGRVRYNSAALVFESEVAQSDGALRASNAEGDSIRVAGVSRTGVDPANLAAFRFRVRNPAGLQSLAFEIDELHQTTRDDLKHLVRRGQAPRILK
jgi:hypothetical protein